MKKLIYFLTGIALLLFISACQESEIVLDEMQIAPDELLSDKAAKEKVTICHYDKDLDESYQLTISVNGLSGHMGDDTTPRHEGDVFPEYVDGEFIPLPDSDGDGIIDCADCYPEDETKGEKMIWYQDLDGDGFGNPAIYIKTCEVRPGYVADNTDCDDTVPAILGEYIFEWLAPDGFKHHIIIDNFNSSDGTFTGYGHFIYISHTSPWAQGDEPLTISGSIDKNTLTFTGVLDYENSGNHPFSGTMTACDGLTGSYPVTIYPYIDADSDNFSEEEGDCDDSNPLINPDAVEICGDGIDNNCDGYSANWSIIGNWTIDFDFGSSYVHNMTIVDNTFTGTGYYVTNPGYTWTVTGTITNSTITMHIVYTGINPGYYLDVTGTIASDGSMSGTASNDSQNATWTTTSGTATCN